MPGNHPIAGTYRGREEVWDGYLAPFWSTPAQIIDRGLLSHPDHRLVAALFEVVHDLGDGELHLGGIEVARTAEGQVAERWEFEEDPAMVDQVITQAAERRSPSAVSGARRPQLERTQVQSKERPMDSVALAVPIQPGKTEALRAYVQELEGARLAEEEAFHRSVATRLRVLEHRLAEMRWPQDRAGTGV